MLGQPTLVRTTQIQAGCKACSVCRVLGNGDMDGRKDNIEQVETVTGCDEEPRYPGNISNVVICELR